MFLQNITRKISSICHEYPRTFWNVVLISFIDHIGGVLIFTFFALYITSKFGVGMTQVGVLFAAAFSLFSFGYSAVPQVYFENSLELQQSAGRFFM